MSKYSEKRTRENLGEVYTYADSQIKKHGGQVYKGIKQECEKVCDSDFYKLDDLRLVPTMPKDDWVDMVIERYPSFSNTKQHIPDIGETVEAEPIQGSIAPADERTDKRKYEQTSIDFDDKASIYDAMAKTYKDIAKAQYRLNLLMSELHELQFRLWKP